MMATQRVHKILLNCYLSTRGFQTVRQDSSVGCGRVEGGVWRETKILRYLKGTCASVSCSRKVVIVIVLPAYQHGEQLELQQWLWQTADGGN